MNCCKERRRCVESVRMKDDDIHVEEEAKASESRDNLTIRLDSGRLTLLYQAQVPTALSGSKDFAGVVIGLVSTRQQRIMHSVITHKSHKMQCSFHNIAVEASCLRLRFTETCIDPNTFQKG